MIEIFHAHQRVASHVRRSQRAGHVTVNEQRRYELDRLEAACERALAINAISYFSVSAIVKSGLDRTSPSVEPVSATPPHANIRGGLCRRISSKTDIGKFSYQ